MPAPQGNKYGPLAMWGFANNGDLSYELNKNAEIYQWSAGIQRLLPGDIVVSADYSANRSTHLPWGSFAAGTRNRNFIPSDIRVTLHDMAVERPVRESIPAAFLRAECDLQRA